MKYSLKHSLKILSVLFALTLLLAQPASAAELQQTANTVGTSATSTIYVNPDLVQLSLNIRTEENSAALAQENNAAAVTKTMDLLSSEGLNKDKIKTTSYSTYSYTKTDDDKNAKELTVYSTNSGLEVTFKELNLVGDILDKLADISAVNVNSVTYSIQDPSQYKQQVINAAIAAAKQNILYSAEALNVKPDKIAYLNIDFNSNDSNQIFPRDSVAVKGSAIPQPQNPDKITLSATATLSYLIQQ